MLLRLVKIAMKRKMTMGVEAVRGGAAGDLSFVEEDFVYESRRAQYAQYKLCTPPGKDPESDEDSDPPKAPSKRRRRILPWSPEGRKLWPGVWREQVCGDVGVVEEEGQSENLEDEGVRIPEDWAHDAQPRSPVGVELERFEVESLTESGQSSLGGFVVDDDASSVCAEMEASRAELQTTALNEVRQGLEEDICRLERKLKDKKAKLLAIVDVGADAEEGEAHGGEFSGYGSGEE